MTQSAPRTLFADTTAMETETDASASQELQETTVKVRSPFYGVFFLFFCHPQPLRRRHAVRS